MCYIKRNENKGKSVEKRIYVGATRKELKEKYVNHLLLFKYERCRNNTMLLKHMGTTNEGQTPVVECDIIKKIKKIRKINCNLCVE